MRKSALWSIRFYQKYLSFDKNCATCRFIPVCSQYCYQAISKYGILHGTWLGLKRVVRCHPGSAGGIDPVP